MKIPVQRLKNTLNRLYDTVDFELHKKNDPIEFPHRYTREEDIEVVAFIACLFAYGKVSIFKTFLERLFATMGGDPYDFLISSSDAVNRKLFQGMRYRFNDEGDILLLFRTLRKAVIMHGSIRSMFLTRYRASEQNIKRALEEFVADLYQLAGKKGIVKRGFRHLLPSPARGGSCKRLNLFLRWMVRDRDIDFGLWKEVEKNRIVIPLDTHVARISRCLGLTERKSNDWKTAVEITESLKLYAPADPLRYDFALSHLGISGSCRADESACITCRLR